MRHWIIKSFKIGEEEYTTNLVKASEEGYTLASNTITINITNTNFTKIHDAIWKAIFELFLTKEYSSKEWTEEFLELYNSCTFYRFDEMQHLEPFDSFKYDKETNTMKPVKLTIKDLV